MHFFKILSTIIFFYSSSLFAQKNEFNQAIATLLRDDLQILVLGEAHNNSALSFGVNDLLQMLRKQKNFNCLFLELSNDIQTQLDEAIANKNIKYFSRVVIDSKIPAMVHAYQKMGVTGQGLETVKLALKAAQESSLERFPFNQDTMNLLADNNISLVPYDANFNSQEIYDQTEVVVMDNYYPREKKRDIEGMRISNLRSKIMSQNIMKQFKLKKCDKAIVVVGYAHLYSSDFFNQIYKSDLTLVPLQDLLSAGGFKNKVIINERQNNNLETTITHESDSMNRFNGFFGRFLTP